jgi:hypothetical protein
MIKKYEGISRRDFLYKFFSLWNTIQPKKYKLTEKEILLFVEFLLLGKQYKYFRFNTQAKREVKKTMEKRENWIISDQNLSQLLGSLEKKGVLKQDDDGVRYILPYFDTIIEESNKNFKLTIEFDIE